MKLYLALHLFILLTPAYSELKVFPSKNHDVSKYSTYQWLPIRLFTKSGIKEDDPDISPVIRQAVNRELLSKGYKEVADGGELQVLAAGVGIQTSQLEGFLVTYGFDVFWGYYGPTTVSPISRINREGTLVVGLVDQKTKKGVWCGYDTEALGKPEGLEKTINKAAGKLIKKLPEKK